MSTSAELEAEIRRLYFAEHWRVGTIATQKSVHADVVKRVIGLPRPVVRGAPRARLVDPYAAFIEETLRQYPTLRATRLYDMLRPRGYTGAVRTLREYVATVRPRPVREAFLTIEPLIGEQAQVDWAHVGKIQVPGGERSLWLFVIVLSWSRAMWGEFVFDLSVHSLLRSLTRAADYFGGCTRQWLFDNPKTVVLERYGDAVRFHPALLEHGGRYCVSLRVCGVRKANQKGRVERAIRYTRERFLAGREIRSIEQGNRELLRFLDEIAHARPHPTRHQLTVADCLAEEKTRLLPLPKDRPSLAQVLPVSIDKTASARFDTNSYSVPSEFAQSKLTLSADDLTVRLLDGDREVAAHRRSWGRRQRIEDPAHRAELLALKRGARESTGQERLRAAAPGVDALFTRWLELGRNIGNLTARMLSLLDSYGESTLAAAVTEVLDRGTNDPGAVAICCERLRRAADKPLPLDVPLGSHVPDREVIPHPLEAYDAKRK